MDLLIKNIVIVNEGTQKPGSILIDQGKIRKILSANEEITVPVKTEIDGKGRHLFPGIIDDQVHFREPGLTQKADIYTESKAAIAGGITSFMEMPNTVPQTTNQQLLAQKFKLGEQKSLANFSFYLGATNDNLHEITRTNPKEVCGVKVFMGSSTGNMLVDDQKALAAIFAESPLLIATHCEDESTIRNNISKYKKKYGEQIPIHFHPRIRSEEACFKSSSLAVELAQKYNTRLHILHLSTAKELELLDPSPSSINKKITAEVCVHHLWFSEDDYQQYGTRIKWNPAIKTSKDRDKLLEGLRKNRIDVVATDHAPHTWAEKENSYLRAPSGGPLVQHSFPAMLELYHQQKITLEEITQKMCHTPAEIFRIDKRGYIREGYWADLVLVDLNDPWTVEKNNILYKCNWSPFEGQTFNSKITHTLVNGNIVYDQGDFREEVKGMKLIFNRS
ncbi:MAG: dihydroorotase [Bacteroidales bacterium]|jgi:dihydroorotase|nr:dihydroorotase [Bacteroidales bacterium]